MGRVPRTVQGILGTFQEDLRLFGDLRNDDARGVRIQLSADHALGKSGMCGIPEVIEEGLQVLREFFSEGLDPGLIPAYVETASA